MSSEYQTAETLDVTGQSCPMPVVKTGQAIGDLEAGDVLEARSGAGTRSSVGMIADDPFPADSSANYRLVPVSFRTVFSFGERTILSPSPT